MSKASQFSKFRTNGRINGLKLLLDSTVRDFNMWPLVVLTGDRIDGRCFFVRKCMTVLPGRKNVTVITR